MLGLQNSKFYVEILISSNQMGKIPCFKKVHHWVKVASHYYHIIYFVLSVDISHHSTYCICHLLKKVLERIPQGQVFDSTSSPYYHPEGSIKENPTHCRDPLWKMGSLSSKADPCSSVVNKLKVKSPANQLLRAMSRAPLIMRTHCQRWTGRKSLVIFIFVRAHNHLSQHSK